MEECDEKNSDFLDQFGITVPFSAMHLLQVGVHVTYFLEKGTRVSMRVATKAFIRDKKTKTLDF